MFVKVFSQIFDSSIAENYLTRLVFTDLLTLADLNGVVDMTHESISRRTNVPIETVRAAISELEKPDPRSRTPDCEGRRIKRLDEHRDWGWFVVNYGNFRKIASEEQRREKTRDRVRKYRSGNDVTPCNADVTIGNAGNAKQKQKQKQKQREKESKIYCPASRTALFFLNEQSGKGFRENETNLKLISQRLSEDGVDIEGVKKMIVRQCKRWKGTEMAEYLRPETLFNKTKFDGYYAARDLPVEISSEQKQLIPDHSKGF